MLLSNKLGVWVGDLFASALIAGVMLSGGYALYSLGLPPAPWDGPGPCRWKYRRNCRVRRWQAKLLARCCRRIMLLIFSVLGSIFFGIATRRRLRGWRGWRAVLLAALNKRLDGNC